MAHILSFGQWWAEGPREVIVALIIWIFGLAVGSYLGHRHIVKPMQDHRKIEESRHKEIMNAHNDLKNIIIK